MGTICCIICYYQLNKFRMSYEHFFFNFYQLKLMTICTILIFCLNNSASNLGVHKQKRWSIIKIYQSGRFHKSQFLQLFSLAGFRFSGLTHWRWINSKQILVLLKHDFHTAIFHLKFLLPDNQFFVHFVLLQGQSYTVSTGTDRHIDAGQTDQILHVHI